MKNLPQIQKNIFYDINKFPKDWGIIVMPISMSRIANSQSPQACMEAIEHLRQKITANRVGAHFIYSEGLYMNLQENVCEKKNHYAQNAVSHMQGIRRIVEKNYMKYQIDNAFSFDSWFQMYLSHKSFFNVLSVVKEFYAKDVEFQKQVALDAKEQGKELTEKQIDFYLEEHTFAYLLYNRQLTLRNDFVNNRQAWVFFCYPGTPPRGAIYLYQQDPCKINGDSNPYKGQYDWTKKKFVDYRNVDLEAYSVNY